MLYIYCIFTIVDLRRNAVFGCDRLKLVMGRVHKNSSSPSAWTDFRVIKSNYSPGKNIRFFCQYRSETPLKISDILIPCIFLTYYFFFLTYYFFTHGSIKWITKSFCSSRLVGRITKLQNSSNNSDTVGRIVVRMW